MCFISFTSHLPELLNIGFIVQSSKSRVKSDEPKLEKAEIPTGTVDDVVSEEPMIIPERKSGVSDMSSLPVLHNITKKQYKLSISCKLQLIGICIPLAIYIFRIKINLCHFSYVQAPRKHFFDGS